MSAAPSDRAAARGGAEWAQRAERGSVALIRFIVWFARRAGRGPARMLLRVVTAYFFVFARAARRASRAYLARCLGRPATLSEQYRHLFAFASITLDRVFLLEDRFDLFDVEVHGGELFEGRGVLVMGGHIGSFEATRALGRGRARSVAMAMYEENARKVQSALAAVAPERVGDIVALGRLDSMLRLSERLEAGALVGVLADRTLGDEPVLRLPFLGTPAPFPIGPMRMAAALRQRVLFMAGLYRGGNRYEVHFEPLADFSAIGNPTREQRAALIDEGVAAFARRLEHYCRAAPDNFFNFYDFWK